MLDLLTIAIEAHSDERNHHRRYEVSVGRDLLGDWSVIIGYGRVGQVLRRLRFGGPDAGEMQRLVREHLARRLSAPRRIGCAYKLRGLSVAGGVSAAEWVPGEMLAKLA